MAQQMQHVDLVIVDRTLPELSGLDVCRRIREKSSLYELPILLLTSAGYPDHAIAANEAGANDFLTKHSHLSDSKNAAGGTN
ncbi:MAG: arcB 2 [Paenibacillus sp.]|jgi:DNA-binding response OmpR family regulator|nr:arcB 2 [Paenibacillus sp.]